VPGIKNWGHGGGSVSGILLGVLLGYHEKKGETTVHRLVAMACGLVTLGCLAWAAVGAIGFRLFQ
jgi:rhomboid protease GluP